MNCKLCNGYMVPASEEHERKILTVLAESSVKATAPIVVCSQCQWEPHFGRPVPLAKLNEYLGSLCGEHYA